MEYYIGIDLGGTNIAAALVEEQGKILGRANLATGAGRPAAEIAADMAHAGRRAAEQAGVPIEQVSAVGMGVPGTANQKEGVLEFANNLGFLHEPIVEMMAGCFPGKKIWFDNDANAAAWGEYLAGGGRGADSMIAVTLGTGVGGGIILGGKLWNGVNYGAGELGHMVIDRNGQVLKSQTIPGLSGLYCDREGFYFYEAYNPEGKIRTGMLDATLQIVIPAETYETLAIATLQDYLIEPMDYLLASRSVKNAELTDILDLNGNVIFAGASRIFSRGQDRFAVLRGEEAGLINGQGEWLVKRSVYSLGWDD